MRPRAAALAAALTLLLASSAAFAAKPTHAVQHSSAARGLGPESVARSARRQSQRASRRPSARKTQSKVTARQSERPARSARKPIRHEVSSPAQTRSRRGRRNRRNSRAERTPERAAVPPSRSTLNRFRAVPLSPASEASLAPPPGAGVAEQWNSIEQQAGSPVLLPNLRVASLYDSNGRLRIPAPLYGSREILLRQNAMAGKDGLDRVSDNAALADLLRQKKLVALPAGETLEIDERLPGNRRYSRPWTAAFLSVMARDFYANFHEPLQVTSAVRTIEVQRRLVRTNGNAAPVSGESASPHLTGQAIDIAKHGLTMTQIAWLRTYLQPLIGDGKIDVEEEFRQACFHISVYRKYLAAAPRAVIAAAQPVAAPPQP